MNLKQRLGIEAINKRHPADPTDDGDRRQRQQVNVAEITLGAMMLALLLICVADRIVESVLS